MRLGLHLSGAAAPDPAVGAWARRTTRRASAFGWWALRLGAPARGLWAYERVYAYFRWADDRVDAPDRDPAEVAAFVAGQAALIAGERAPAALAERALAEALAAEPRLGWAVGRMWEALRFDAARDARPLPAAALDAQVARVGDAFLHALWVCLGQAGEPPPGLEGLARAATRAHLLRDRGIDEGLGYLNRPPGPDGAPIPVAEWTARLTAAADGELRVGRAALAALPSWRARVLLGLWSWRYARQLAGARHDAR